MTMKNILIGAALLVGGVVVYRRLKGGSTATQTTTQTLTSAARSIVDSGKTLAVKLGVATAAPAELAPGGVPYGTVATTDTRRTQTASRFVPANEVNRSYAQDAMLGFVGGEQFRA